MLTAQLRVPRAVNEPILNYAPGSPERAALKAELQRQSAERLDIPLFIGGREIRTGRTGEARMPHAHQHVLATYHQADAALVGQAIDAALAAKRAWAELPFHQRAAIFLRAADLLATKYRARLNAATMLNQSKTAFQAEIDSACELADFLRFNVAFAEQILQDQPLSSALTWNQMDYRPLDGFVFAASPFNFTAIAGNLPSAPALMGNTVVWKPSDKSTYSNWHVLQLFREAGLPDGVINMVQGDAAMIAGQVLAHPELGGVHFTGSTSVFQGMWRTVGENITRYRQYPRLVGETGGKDFVFAHPSAKDDLDALAVALVRGAYEFQGQKCSAASRAFIPASLWPELRDRTVALIGSIRMGDVRDFRNFMSAVIDERSFKRLTGYLEAARNDTEVKVLAGGEGDSREGWFVQPTLVEARSPSHRLMCEELFGPVLAVHVYEDARFEETLRVCDESAPYALTGAFFARDRKAIETASRALRHTAGNFYLNDKPTGAVVGQQPFGGSRASGTNDKAGSALNLLRWVSPRTIKENFVPPTGLGYPFMGEQ